MPDPDALKPSRPTIFVAGTQSSSLTGGLLRLRVREDVHGLASCEAEFGNWGPNGDSSDFLYFDRRLKLGDGVLFSGRITGLEGRYPQGNSPSVVVLAEDRFQDLRMTRRTRTFADVSDADVVSQIASDHGLTADVGISGPKHKVLAQLNQSDLAFLRERARALDAELWMTDSKLSVKPRSSRGGSPITLTYGKELREFRVLADLAGQATSLEVTGWDVAGKTGLKERADGAVVGGELNGGEQHGVLGTEPGHRLLGRAGLGRADPGLSRHQGGRLEMRLDQAYRVAGGVQVVVEEAVHGRVPDLLAVLHLSLLGGVGAEQVVKGIPPGRVLG
jgi:hypothetical protein